MKIDIVLPSYHRNEPLKNCLKSITVAVDKAKLDATIAVGYSDEEDLRKSVTFCEEYGIVQFMHVGVFTQPNFWNVYLGKMESDALVYLNDDVLLDEDCFVEAMKIFDKGKVIGLCQSNANNPTACSTAFGIMGINFINLFQDRIVFCPNYESLYVDEEVGVLAKKLDRFVYCEKAKLQHLHPAFTGKQPDETHKWNKRNKQKDVLVYNKRKKLGLLWGESYKLVGE